MSSFIAKAALAAVVALGATGAAVEANAAQVDAKLQMRGRSQRRGNPPCGDEFLHESGIDDRAPTENTIDDVEEFVEVGYPTLEDVAAPPATCEQRHGMCDLDVGRQDQDRRVGKLPTDRGRSLEALRRVVGRHADVDDCELRLLLANDAQQL